MNDLRFIALSGKRGEGKFTIVDERDFERLSSAFTWNFNSRGYAASGVYDGFVRKMYRGKFQARSKSKTVLLHHEVFGHFVWPERFEVDHENHNKLDNRRCNLRICTSQQNRASRPKQVNKKRTNYKGVSLRKNGRFQGYIGSGRCGTRVCLGTFDTQEEAAHAYDLEAIRRWGEFAYTNFPRSDYEVRL